MKKLLLSFLALTLSFGVVAQENDTNFTVLEIVTDFAILEIVTDDNFGKISFATDSTWTIGSQIWSDAVQTSVCNNKTTFLGNSADCRSNPNHKGDLFSFNAVSEFKYELCPYPWRVPTKQDFIDLDITLGGNGNLRSDMEIISSKYLNSAVWGGAYGGFCLSGGWLSNQGTEAVYWSQSEYLSNGGYCLTFGDGGGISPQGWDYKDMGFSLRCVRDK